MVVVLWKKSKSIHLKEESRIWKGLLGRDYYSLGFYTLPSITNCMESIL
jgi:hypothetical protein